MKPPSLPTIPESPPWQPVNTTMPASDGPPPEVLPPIITEAFLYERSSFQQHNHQSTMANILAGAALWIGEDPDLTLLISDGNNDQQTAQQDDMSLKLHKSVLGEYEYFKQRFETQPDMKTFELPSGDVNPSVIVDMFEYMYTKSTAAIERGCARSELTYSTYHISLFQLSLRFYLPELERIAEEALDQEEIGIKEGGWEEMEQLIWSLYDNRRGKKWEALRQKVMKRQAWKLIKMPKQLLERLDERFPGFQVELAEMWRQRLMGSQASRGSGLMNWRN